MNILKKKKKQKQSQQYWLVIPYAVLQPVHGNARQLNYLPQLSIFYFLKLLK